MATILHHLAVVMTGVRLHRQVNIYQMIIGYISDITESILIVPISRFGIAVTVLRRGLERPARLARPGAVT